jgi:hypothetical protein
MAAPDPFLIWLRSPACPMALVEKKMKMNTAINEFTLKRVPLYLPWGFIRFVMVNFFMLKMLR